MTKPLTAKQQRFAELVALKGLMLVDAYRQAYDTRRMTDKTAHESASKLAADPKVSARIQALRAELQERAVEKELWSRVDSITVLKEIATDQESRGNEKVSAVKELNAMHGFSTLKVEHSGAVAVQLEITDSQKLNACLAIMSKLINNVEVSDQVVTGVDTLARHLVKSDRRGELLDVFKRHLTAAEGWDFA